MSSTLRSTRVSEIGYVLCESVRLSFLSFAFCLSSSSLTHPFPFLRFPSLSLSLSLLLLSITEHQQQPFGQYLQDKGLTPHLVQFIVYCIAMVNEDVPTIEVSHPLHGISAISLSLSYTHTHTHTHTHPHPHTPPGVEVLSNISAQSG